MLIDKPEIIFYVGTGSFKHPLLTFTPKTSDERYLFAAIALDNKPLQNSKRIRFFAATNGELSMPSFSGKWLTLTRFFNTARGGTAEVSDKWFLDHAPNTLCFDLIR